MGSEGVPSHGCVCKVLLVARQWLGVLHDHAPPRRRVPRRACARNQPPARLGGSACAASMLARSAAVAEACAAVLPESGNATTVSRTDAPSQPARKVSYGHCRGNLRRGDTRGARTLHALRIVAEVLREVRFAAADARPRHKVAAGALAPPVLAGRFRHLLRCVLHAARCALLRAVRCVLRVVCCMLRVAHCTLTVRCVLHVASVSWSVHTAVPVQLHGA